MSRTGLSQKEIRKIGKRGLDDFYFFDHVIRGYLRKVNGHGCAMTRAEHGRQHDFYQRFLKNGPFPFYIGPRDSFKSDCFSVGLSMRILAEYPNDKILLFGGVKEMPTSRLSQITQEMALNDLYRDCYGDHTTGALINKTSSFSSGLRRMPDKTGSIECGSVDGENISKHYDWILPDDCSTDKNCKTAGGREKVKEALDLLGPLLEKPYGRMCGNGTIWHFDDAHVRICNDPDWEVLKVPAREDSGKLNFPSRLTALILAREERNLGPHRFAGNYLCKAMNPADASFQKGWLLTYDLDEALSSGFFEDADFFVCWDPAGPERKGSDYAGIVVHAVKPNRNIYLVEAIRDKIDPYDQVKIVLGLCLRWGAVKLAVEKGSFNVGFRHWVETEMLRRKIPVTIVPVSHESRAKTDRIRDRLQPYYRAKQIFWPETLVRLQANGTSIDTIQAFKGEFLEFPHSKHEHLLEAQSFLPLVMFAPEPKTQNLLSEHLESLSPREREFWTRYYKENPYDGEKFEDDISSGGYESYLNDSEEALVSGEYMEDAYF